MDNKEALQQIRHREKQSHIAAYSGDMLYKQGSWLSKPVKTVLDLLPNFDGYSSLHVLDLGCGVGRNCIAIAKHFQTIPCFIDCVDILELAIEKLKKYAEDFAVSEKINGTVMPIEDYRIAENHYDLVLAISALEHVDSEESFVSKLTEIRDGIRHNGIVCLVVNTNVREYDKVSGAPVPAQFEVNLPTDKMQELLACTFAGWEILKNNVCQQQYDIPREHGIHDLHTSVVTLAAKKK